MQPKSKKIVYRRQLTRTAVTFATGGGIRFTLLEVCDPWSINFR